jgi:hypothetical protein
MSTYTFNLTGSCADDGFDCQITLTVPSIDLARPRAEAAAEALRQCILAPRDSVTPAYLAIMGLNCLAVPIILRELQRWPDHWFRALSAITGENPIQEGHAGNLKQMTQDWLDWGRARGYIA